MDYSTLEFCFKCVSHIIFFGLFSLVIFMLGGGFIQACKQGFKPDPIIVEKDAQPWQGR